MLKCRKEEHKLDRQPQYARDYRPLGAYLQPTDYTIEEEDDQSEESRSRYEHFLIRCSRSLFLCTETKRVYIKSVSEKTTC